MGYCALLLSNTTVCVYSCEMFEAITVYYFNNSPLNRAEYSDYDVL